MKLKADQKIPSVVLDSINAHANVPFKQVNAFTVRICDAVESIKGAKAIGTDASRGWNELKRIIDDAVGQGDFSAFDDMAKAWESLEVKTGKIILSGASVRTVTGRKNLPRAKTPRLIATALDLLQDQLGRIPTRRELLDFMASNPAMPENIAMDDSELSRQLKKLGLQESL